MTFSFDVHTLSSYVIWITSPSLHPDRVCTKILRTKLNWSCLQKLAHFKMAQLYWGARGLSGAKVQYTIYNVTRLSPKNYNPRATGRLRHFMLKLFYTVLKTVPFSVNSSTFVAGWAFAFQVWRPTLYIVLIPFPKEI